MGVQLKLSVKEAKQIYQILKAFNEGLIVNPSEEWELDYYDEKIADRKGLKPILKTIEKSLPKEESEETKKTVLRRRYDTFNNEINESVYRKIESAFNNQKTVEIDYFDMASAETRKREIDVYHKTRKSEYDVVVPKHIKKEFELAEKINEGDSIKTIGDKNISVVFCDRLERLHKPVKYDEKQSKLVVQ
jgi:hypothetical protein